MPCLDNKIVTSMTIYVDDSSHNSPSFIYAKQFDSNSRYIKVKLMDQSGQIIPDSTVKLNAVKPDGTQIYVDGEINSDGTITFEITGSLLTDVGNIVCDISIFDLEDSELVLLTSSSFYIIVDKSNYSVEAVEGSDSIPDLIEGASELGDSPFFLVIQTETISGEQQTVLRKIPLNAALISKVDKINKASRVYITTNTGAQSSLEYTDAKTASTIVKRDSSGRFKAAAPSGNDHVATKKYVDDAVAGAVITVQAITTAEISALFDA